MNLRKRNGKKVGEEPTQVSNLKETEEDKQSEETKETEDSREIENNDNTKNSKGFEKASMYIKDSEKLQLSRQDKLNCAMLILLYMLQGVPVGLVFGSVPYLLKTKLSYGDIGFFSLAAYPYSLKLLWSPIVDSFYHKGFGRRKTWIVPIQTLGGIIFFCIGLVIDDILKSDHINVSLVTFFFFLLILCAATQDIAVDGWALELLPKELCEYASTCQTIGINIGYFLSFTIFLALNSNEFCSKYFGQDEALDEGFLSLGIYMQFWGVFSVVFCFWLAFCKKERPCILSSSEMTVKETYSTIVKIAKKSHMIRLITMLLLHKIGFMANDAVTFLLLIEKGFKREDLALTVLIDFPCQIVLGIFAAKWSTGPRPTRPWMYALVLRLTMCVISTWVLYIFPSEGVTTAYFLLVVCVTLISSFASTTMFVSQGAFFARISDPAIGGTYLTLLATFSNFGGTWPKLPVLYLVDHFTIANCSVSGNECVTEVGKSACRASDGVCTVEQQGYYTVSFMCITFGCFLYFFFVRKTAKDLEKLDSRAWTVAN